MMTTRKKPLSHMLTEILFYNLDLASHMYTKGYEEYENDEINLLFEGIIEEINKNITPSKFNLNKAEVSHEKQDRRTEKFLIFIAILALIFFVFVILDAYYLDDTVLTIIGMVLIMIALAIHTYLIIVDGKVPEFKKLRIKDERTIFDFIRNRTLNICAVKNKVLWDSGLHLGLSKDGHKLSLFNFAVGGNYETNADETIHNKVI